ncbi:hypothetical protein ACFYTS_11580 [Nocardia sp. NPDC004151]|uniref:hypothetical protein n=1 Tax=Nocardia sp. NPDC004151 TaxID=3364304 RepID=UPI0036BA1087
MIYPSASSITSSVTGECAERLPRHPEPAWRLSWRQSPLLTREEALAAMELTELLRREPSGSGPAWTRACALGAALGIDVEDARIVLRERRRERGES